MKFRLIAVVLPLLTMLQGCWFIFIPGSVTGAVTDAITGSEGANCVGSNVKVGDKVRFPDGRQGSVKSLSGTSVRCTNPQAPIRALLTDSVAVAPPVAITSGLQIDLPSGWERKALTEPMIANGSITYAINRTIDSGVILSSTKRDGITDLLSFALSRRATQESRLTDVSKTDVIELQLNGRRAFRFTVTGLTGNLRVTYQATVIEGTREIAILNSWTSAPNFDQRSATLMTLANAISGL